MATPDYAAELKDLDGRRSRNLKKWDQNEQSIGRAREAATKFAAKLETDLIMTKGFHEHADDLYAKWRPLADEIIKLQAEIKTAKGDKAKVAELEKKIAPLHKKAATVRAQIQKNIDRAVDTLKQIAGRVDKMLSLAKG
ncbi:MAG: hypothetical protein AAGC57_16490 [Pseudomonadota bacterium]